MSQALDALDRANEVRIAASNLRKAVLKGETTMEDAIHSEDANSLKIDWLLQALPRWGAGRAGKLRSIALPHRNSRTRVSELTDREKKTLLAYLRERGVK